MIYVRYFAFFILLVSLFLSRGIQASGSEIYALDLINRHSPKHHLHYNQLWQVLAQNGLPKVQAVLPLKRWLNQLKDNPKSCIFPSKISALRQGLVSAEHKLIEGEGTDYVGLAAFTRPGEMKIQGVKDFKGRKVGMWNGLDMPHITQHLTQSQVTFVKDEDQLVRLLHSKRVDLILSFFPDVRLTAHRLKLPIPQHDDRFWLLPKYPVTLVCNDTRENRQLIKRFNVQIQQLKDSGRLTEILGPLVEVAL